jgi:hypothetical protein
MAADESQASTLPPFTGAQASNAETIFTDLRALLQEMDISVEKANEKVNRTYLGHHEHLTPQQVYKQHVYYAWSHSTDPVGDQDEAKHGGLKDKIESWVSSHDTGALENGLLVTLPLEYVTEEIVRVLDFELSQEPEWRYEEKVKERICQPLTS